MTTLSRGLWALIAVLLLRAAFHAVFLPVFEGPDEPFHVDRTLPHQGDPAFLTSGVVDSVRNHPCGGDLHRAFGCPTFDGSGAFNVLRPVTRVNAEISKERNYEAHQPPLYYVLARPLGSIVGTVESAVLWLRVAALLLIAAGVLILLEPLAAEVRVAAVVVLMLPGAMESLIRASNDALVFLWAAVMLRLYRQLKFPWLVVLAAAGPLVKLSAFAISAVIVAGLLLRGRRGAAVASAIASAAVLPVQLLRGWAWGGTYEMNIARAAIQESAPQILVGLGRSVYTFVKTTFWVGGWSFFRAPLALVLLFFLLLVVSIGVLRWRERDDRIWIAHLLGALVAAAGFFVIAVGNRRLFGTWGGLGGWYFWGWFPWLAFAVDDLVQIRPGACRGWLTLWTGFVLISNIVWFFTAFRLYGP